MCQTLCFAVSLQYEIWIRIECGQLFEGMALLAPVLEVGWSHCPKSAVGERRLPEHKKATGIRIGQWLKKNAIYDGKDGSVRADAKRQCEDDHG